MSSSTNLRCFSVVLDVTPEKQTNLLTSFKIVYICRL